MMSPTVLHEWHAVNLFEESWNSEKLPFLEEMKEHGQEWYWTDSEGARFLRNCPLFLVLLTVSISSDSGTMPVKSILPWDGPIHPNQGSQLPNTSSIQFPSRIPEHGTYTNFQGWAPCANWNVRVLLTTTALRSKSIWIPKNNVKGRTKGKGYFMLKTWTQIYSGMFKLNSCRATSTH